MISSNAMFGALARSTTKKLKDQQEGEEEE
jgi:hypothetical protein